MRPPAKILIIRFSSIGDIILTSPVIRLLRENLPGARIDFLVKKEFSELVRWNKDLTNVVVLNTGGSAALQEMKALRERIRSEHYDLIVDLHNSLRSRYLRFFSGARRVRVVKKFVVRRFLLVQLKWNLFRRVTTVVERYLKTVKAYERTGDADAAARVRERVRPPLADEGGAGGTGEPGGDRPAREVPEIFLPPDIASTVDGIIFAGKFGKDDRLAGLAPCSKHFTKRWPMERFVQLAAKLSSEYGVKFLIFGGPGETDYCGDIAQLINAQTGTHRAESFAGKLSLSETAAAMDRCGLIVTNDTGLMHMATARRRRVLAIFGSTVKELGFYPAGPGNIVMENKGLGCRPCSHIGLSACPKDHFKCMTDITVGGVASAAGDILDPAPDIRGKTAG